MSAWSSTENFAIDFPVRFRASEYTEEMSFRNSSRPARREMTASCTDVSSIRIEKRTGFPLVIRQITNTTRAARMSRSRRAAARMKMLFSTQPLT